MKPNPKTVPTSLLMLSVSLSVAIALSAVGAAGLCQDDTVVATVKGESITMAELEASIEGQLQKLEQQRHQLLENAVGPLVDDRLLAAEAKERELTKRELVALEVDAQTTLVTEDDIDLWYEQNKARLGKASRVQVADQIKQLLTKERAQKRRTDYLSELRAKHDAKVLLEPRRTEIDLATATFELPA